MSIKSFAGILWAKFRAKQIQNIRKQALPLQEKTFHELIHKGSKTAFGKAHAFSEIKTIQDFQENVPVRNYEQAKEWFDRIYKGEADVSWPGKPLYLAKTSGTTSGTKYIPITKESISKQVSGARDAIMLYIAEADNADFVNGKMMFLSGSPEIEINPHGIKTGRLSGIVNFPPENHETP